MLRNRFKKLELVMDGVACVRICDPEILRILIKELDVDGIGAISEEYVINNQFEFKSGWFRGNILIETFNEFEFMNVMFTDSNYNGSDLFADCTSLRSIKPPRTLTFLPVRCFKGCSGLSNIVLNNGLKEIRTEAFKGCVSLQSINIPNTVTKISGGAFMDTGIEIMDLPESVTTIGSYVFNGLKTLKTMIIRGYVVKADGVGEGSLFKCWENCTSLESFIMLSKTPMEFGFWMLNGTTCKIYVPDTAVSIYKATINWDSLADRIHPLSEYKGEL